MICPSEPEVKQIVEFILTPPNSSFLKAMLNHPLKSTLDMPLLIGKPIRLKER